MSENYEQLGKFYLGKAYSLKSHSTQAPLVLYDSPDLTTHAMIVGMTGSGKTGLGISLLEEALMDNIPLIAIDSKGDLSNLLLTFETLSAASFLPWVDGQAAADNELSIEDYAQAQADLWATGLEDSEQSVERIQKLRSRSEIAVYTPGSSAGLPISLLRSFDVPPAAVMDDSDLRREYIQNTVTSLLGLLSIDADPVTSQEYILLANILESTWSAGDGIDLAGLTQAIATPPFEQIGAVDIESFYPTKARMKLATQLNNLLASPSFEVWMTGEPLDIQKLLYTPDGKPRAAIFSTAHLSEPERMFFITMLLNAMLSWMRTQPVTESLRSLLYMDEIFGYLPPAANPPSKQPLLTMLNQAEAFGLGLILSTQNPADLDYKALSNIGTWFIGKLQTDRDKAQLIEGLKNSSALEATELEDILGRLDQRVFLLHNVHEEQPVIFQTRWTMSYLRGPMTREQIQHLNPERSVAESTAPHRNLPDAVHNEPDSTFVEPLTTWPKGPSTVDTYFVPTESGHDVLYQPAVMMAAEIHYVSKTYSVDERRVLTLITRLKTDLTKFTELNWEDAVKTTLSPSKFKTAPVQEATFSILPVVAKKAETFEKWEKSFARYVRQQEKLNLYRCKSPKLMSIPGEEKSEFIARLRQQQREDRDAAVTKLQQRYAAKLKTADNKLTRAEQTVENQAGQTKQRQVNAAIAIGTPVLGAFMGRKVNGRNAMNSTGQAVRNAGRISQSRQAHAQAEERAKLMREDLIALDAELQQALSDLEREQAQTDPVVEAVTVSPKSANITQQAYGLLWLPYEKDEKGELSADW